MELELENVLKYDFYNEKLSNYHEIALETINYLIQFRAFNLINEEEFYRNMDFFTEYYVKLMEYNQEIRYKYSNMMDEVFDIAFDGDLRAVKGDYISRSKIDDFNCKMESFEMGSKDYISGLNQILDDLSLSKMFTTDMSLLKLLEDDFNITYKKVSTVEEMYGSFEETIDNND